MHLLSETLNLFPFSAGWIQIF
uniref:Uncharacterized protein n=1 Tax=Rhizophora mucronata TaxID=61149 RepID=A0A2P2QKK1_RHIMU